MLAGTPPFQGSTAQSILARHAVDPVPSLRTVRGTIPLGVEQAISRALAKSPADRFATAAEFAEALENGRRQPPVSQVRTRHLALIAGLLILVASAGVAYSVRSRLGPSPLTSLAIAPFENLTGDSAQVYLAQGMTEQLIADLSRIAALKVIRLGQVPTQDSAIAIARDLKLGGVLGGSLQQAGTDVRITVRLVSPATGQAVWGESQEGELARVFDLQERVARAVTDRIKVALTLEERSRLRTSRRPTAPEAYEAYVRGLYFLNRVTETDLRKAMGYFQQAIDLDPAYAAAYAGLAEGYCDLGYFSAVTPKDAFPSARRAALKAIELDSTLSEAYTALGRVDLFFDWDFEAAERDFRRAIELNPKVAWAHLPYSSLLTARGRADEAIAEGLRAQELDPLSLIISAATARAYYNARRYDEAIAQARKPLEIDSTFSRAHYWLGLSYIQKGRLPEAIKELEETIKRAPYPLYRAALGHAYAVAGQQAEARRVLAELEALSRSRYVSSFDVATIYAGLGDRNKTLELLEKAYVERASYLAFLSVDPQFDLLRDDPRFVELLRRIGPPSS